MRVTIIHSHRLHIWISSVQSAADVLASFDGGTRSIHPPDCVASQPGIWLLNLWLTAPLRVVHITYTSKHLKKLEPCLGWGQIGSRSQTQKLRVTMFILFSSEFILLQDSDVNNIH